MSSDNNSTETLTTTIDLMRHGECEGGRIFRGTTDSLLSSDGFEQMNNTIGDNPPSWDLIVSSPLRRCSDYAEMLSIQYQTDLAIEDSFKEIDFGDWEGQEIDSIYSQNAEQVERFWADPIANPAPAAETMQDFQLRTVTAWQQMIEQLKGQNILLVSHGGVIRLLLAHVLGMPLRPLSRLHIPHAALARIQIFHQAGKEDWPQVMFMNNVYP